MATSGELRAIIQDLQLIDIGDAGSYLGEEAIVVEESSVSVQTPSVTIVPKNQVCDRMRFKELPAGQQWQQFDE